MTEIWPILGGVSINMIVIGAIIWGALSREPLRRRRLWLTIGVPGSLVVGTLLLKSEFTLTQRFAGLALTLLISVAWVLYARHQRNMQTS